MKFMDRFGHYVVILGLAVLGFATIGIKYNYLKNRFADIPQRDTYEMFLANGYKILNKDSELLQKVAGVQAGTYHIFLARNSWMEAGTIPELNDPLCLMVAKEANTNRDEVISHQELVDYERQLVADVIKTGTKPKNLELKIDIPVIISIDNSNQ